MLPTLADKHHVLLRSPDWIKGEPVRGDIVVFRRPGPPYDLYIKRVVGMPGEEVRMTAGQVFLDGNLLKENYTTIPPAPGYRDRGEWWTGPNEYVVLGDNRRDSEDSRVFGPVRRELVVGRFWFRYWPVNRWTTFT
jgi:signal peptidase I